MSFLEGEPYTAINRQRSSGLKQWRMRLNKAAFYLQLS